MVRSQGEVREFCNKNCVATLKCLNLKKIMYFLCQKFIFRIKILETNICILKINLGKNSLVVKYSPMTHYGTVFELKLTAGSQ